MVLHAFESVVDKEEDNLWVLEKLGAKMELIDPNDKNKNENVLAYNKTMMTISLTIVFLISFVIILVTLAGNI